jgi:CubicO group peptidase (beta-lactamase class C family)
MKILRLLILPILILQQSYAQVNFVKDSMDAYILQEMQRWQIPGVAIAIVKDGKVVKMQGYGVKELGKTEKVDENTLFQIASNTKAFTGTALAILDYQKRLSLDDKVRKYLPWFALQDNCASEMATLKDILSHRIGFSTFQSDFLNWDCNLSSEALIRNMKNVKPENEFRAKYGYCNMGYVTAGEVIKAVTDTSWQDFFQQYFFTPLEMKRTSVYYQKIVSDANAAKPYTLVNNKLTRIDYANIDNIGACASTNSCVNDLSHWMLMQLDSGKYNQKTIIPFQVINTTRNSYMIVKESGSSRIPSNHFQNYGLGWKLEDMYGYKIVSHDGGANGFVTNTTLIPELHTGFVILTNTDANWFYAALRQQLINHFAGQPYENLSAQWYNVFARNQKQEQSIIDSLKKVASANPVFQINTQELSGTYHNPVYGNIEIKSDKKELTLLLSHHPKLKGQLQILNKNTLLCTYSDPTYGIHEFPVEIENNKVKSITVKVNDFIDYQSYRFEKL